MAEAKRHKAHIKLGAGVNLDSNVLTLSTGEALVARNCDRDHNHAVRKRRGSIKKHRFAGVDPADGVFKFSPVVGIYNHEWDYAERGPIHVHLYVLRNGTVWRKEEGDPPETFVRVPGPDAGVTFDDVVTTHASFATVGGDTYIAVGQGPLRVFDGERLYYAGLAAPEAAPGVSAGAPAGSGISGTFKYVMTHIYRTVDGKFFESNPSTASAEVSPSSEDVTVTWSAHPNATPPGNGERTTGYRLYRTFDLDNTLAPADPNAFFLVTEIEDVTTTSYVDDTSNFELTDLAPGPGERDPPPLGTKLVKEYSGSLFCFSSDENPVGADFSVAGVYEAFPEANRSRLPSSTTSGITAAFKISGILGCTTENEIFHFSGSNPADFTPREMTSYTGCLSPASMKVVHNAAMFHGKNGVYAWDGASLQYLSEDIENDLKGQQFTSARTSCAEVLTEYGHYYLSTPRSESGERHWWVYDLSSEGYSQDVGDDGETTPKRTRAWFDYTGMPATSMGVLRKYCTKEEFLEWGDADGNLWEYDIGDTDDGRTINMEYTYVFMPAENRNKNPIDRMFKVRNVVVHTDQFKGVMRIFLKYLRSHITEFLEAYPPYVRDYPTGEVKETDARFSHYGSSGALVKIRHEGPGEFRIIGVSHEWQPLTKRHQRV